MDNNKVIHEISKAREFTCWLSYTKGLEYIELWAHQFPPNWKYSLIDCSLPSELDELSSLSSLETKEKALTLLSQLKFKWIYIDFFLSENDYSFIWEALLLASIQNQITYCKRSNFVNNN